MHTFHIFWTLQVFHSHFSHGCVLQRPYIIPLRELLFWSLELGTTTIPNCFCLQTVRLQPSISSVVSRYVVIHISLYVTLHQHSFYSPIRTVSLSGFDLCDAVSKAGYDFPKPLFGNIARYSAARNSFHLLVFWPFWKSVLQSFNQNFSVAKSHITFNYLFNCFLEAYTTLQHIIVSFCWSQKESIRCITN